MAHSVLLVPVPEAEAVVRPRLARLSPEQVAVDDETVHAHVTLLGPFAAREDVTPGLLGELDAFFADVTPFAFDLTSVAAFPGGTTYLAPEPASPFRQLTLELSRRFPEYPPYGGAFDDVVPHLSVPLSDGDDAGSLRRALAGRLPVHAHAREAALFWWEPGASRTLATFPFGTSAA